MSRSASRGCGRLLDLRGEHDARGYELSSTMIAVADELAGAAELVMGKANGVPAAIVRGYAVPPGDGSAAGARHASGAGSLSVADTIQVEREWATRSPSAV